MRTVFLRAVGFLLPTSFVVTLLHWLAEPTPGEVIDGLASSAFFALVFLVGATVMALVTSGRRPRRPPTLRTLATGLAVGAATWAAVWLLWRVPGMQPLREWGLAVNAAAVLVSGVLTSRNWRPRREYPAGLGLRPSH